MLYRLAKASWASMAVFLPLNATGSADRLRLLLLVFSVLFFFSLDETGNVKPPFSFTRMETHACLFAHLLLLRCLCFPLEFDRDLARLFFSRLFDLRSPLRERDLFLSQLRLWCRLQWNTNKHKQTVHHKCVCKKVKSVTFPWSVTSTCFSSWRISFLCDADALLCLQTAYRGPYPTAPAPRIRSGISESPSSSPVLRRIGSLSGK